MIVMVIRNAKTGDVGAIHSLIQSYAELDRMLFRSLADIYESLQLFEVAEVDGQVAGCCAVGVVWSDLAEIRSLAIGNGFVGKGIGKALVESALGRCKNLGLGRVFTLTLEPDFFTHIGFRVITKETLPMKVWRDCAKCCKQDACDEVALLYDLGARQ